jgi:hypothetical protein
MAINPEQDDNKQRKKSRFKKFRRIALPAVASLGLLSGGSYFNNEFNHASDRLIELSNEYEQIRRDLWENSTRRELETKRISNEMDKYAERIVSKDSIASIYRLAAETNDTTLVHELLRADDGIDDVTWQTRLGRGKLNVEIFHQLIDELVLTAYEKGNHKFLHHYLYGVNVSDEVLTKILYGLIQAENFRLALTIMGRERDAYLKMGKFFDNEIGPTDEQQKFLEYAFNIGNLTYCRFILEQYLEKGDLNRAQNLVMQAPSLKNYILKTYLELVSDRGNVEEMIAASIFVGFSSDEEIVDFAVTAAMNGHYEAAEKLIERFDLDMNDYFKELWSHAVRNQDEQAAIHLLNKFHELGGDEAVLGVFQPSSNGAFGRFAFNIAKDIGFKLQPASQEALASLFSGTMDDHLRLHWQQGEAEAAHDTPRQIAPAPRP